MDLNEIVADIPEAMKEKVLEWDLNGIKRGMRKATDLMPEGKVYCRTVLCLHRIP